MPQVKKKTWICEECGREFDELPFPKECPCGNWCEDFFREKDIHDEEDDRAGRSLLGVKYDPQILKERNERLGIAEAKTQVVTVPVDTGAEIDFQKMSKKELSRYLRKKGYDVSELKTRKDLLKACRGFEGK